MKYAKLVVPVLALTMVMSACSKNAEETTTTTAAETTTEATTTAAENESADDENEEVDDEEWEDEEWEPVYPDQTMEIDENYMKYYDYKTYYDMDFMSEQTQAKEEEIADDVLKEDYKKLVADGYTVYTADSEAAYLVGEGFYDNDNNGIAYLYRGITGYKESDNSYSTIREYIVSPEILDKLDYIKGEEKDGIITYTEDENKLCPTGATITYDTATQVLKFDNTFEFDPNAVG